MPSGPTDHCNNVNGSTDRISRMYCEATSVERKGMASKRNPKGVATSMAMAAIFQSKPTVSWRVHVPPTNDSGQNPFRNVGTHHEHHDRIGDPVKIGPDQRDQRQQPGLLGDGTPTRKDRAPGRERVSVWGRTAAKRGSSARA